VGHGSHVTDSFRYEYRSIHSLRSSTEARRVWRNRNPHDDLAIARSVNRSHQRDRQNGTAARIARFR
jgi:hypothetical protein